MLEYFVSHDVDIEKLQRDIVEALDMKELPLNLS